MYLKTFDKAKDKYVRAGNLEGDVYHRKVKNAHYMVKEHGYGIQTDVMSKLLACGAKKILIHTKTKDLSASLATWVLRGHRKDYGNGEQVFLSTEFMEG